MIEIIKEYAVAIIAGLGGIGVVGTIINLVKTFSQKTLNKSFETFKRSTDLIESNSANLAVNVRDLTTNIANLFEDLKKAITEMEELKELIQILQSDSLLTEIKDGLLGMDVIKQSIDMKDVLLETFGKEMTKIKEELEKINRKEK